MQQPNGYFALLLHAHLPFVRHPEHQRSLEESWLFEAITETYIPMLQVLERWCAEGIRAPITLTLSPTLCAMLRDPLLQERYARYLDGLLELAEMETHRTLWERPFHRLACFYRDRLTQARIFYQERRANLLDGFRRLQDDGALEIVTTAATHAVLPLLAGHAPSLRAQILTARDEYRSCFGRDPRGIWLPECAYAEELDTFLKEAGLRWFVTDTHGVLNARPRPLLGTFAPVLTPRGLAAFGRDPASAKQVWSRPDGYPGHPHYRDFYRDIGFDLESEYLRPHLPAAGQRTFTGIKYHRITGDTEAKAVYDREAALRTADQHASHFLRDRVRQLQRAASVVGRPPVILAPYDAELFGHWWYEGPEFLDLFVRKAFYDQDVFSFTTPEAFLQSHPTHQVAAPAASSWGEKGYWTMWLNEKTAWIYPHLRAAQERMTELASRPGETGAAASAVSLPGRAIRQAGRELLLAQASDWPFILRTGTSPAYARLRVETHLSRFNRLYEQITGGVIDADWLERIEEADNLFPNLNPSYWRGPVADTVVATASVG